MFSYDTAMPDWMAGQPVPANGLAEVDAHPALGATDADLAGIWVEAESGVAAVHVDASGWIYQVDLSDMVDGEPLPPEIPRVVYNVGRLTVNPDGGITGELSIELPGSSGSGILYGVLGSTLDVITNVVIQGTVVEQGAAESVLIDGIPTWFRWDPQTGTYPFVEKRRFEIVAGIATVVKAIVGDHIQGQTIFLGGDEQDSENRGMIEAARVLLASDLNTKVRSLSERAFADPPLPAFTPVDPQTGEPGVSVALGRLQQYEPSYWQVTASYVLNAGQVRGCDIFYVIRTTEGWEVSATYDPYSFDCPEVVSTPV